MYAKVTYEDAVNNRIFSNPVSKRIVAVLPAHNEENDIAETLKSLRLMKKPKDIIFNIFIALDNCTDNTEEVIRKNSEDLNIYTLETVDNKERKVGALNQVYRLFFGDMSETAEPLAEQHKSVVKNIVAYLGIDADIYMDKNALNTLYAELTSKFNIGSVSANYTCLMPESKRRLRQDDPEAENKIKNGNYGGIVARFITSQQNKSFAQWSLEQKHDGYNATIAGGQCTLFSPKAFQEAYDKLKLNGIYDDSTDTEDLLLTQELRKLGWQPKISHSARCYVGAMKTMHSYTSQQTKWRIGKLDYTTKSGVSTAYARKNWVDELTLMMNVITRAMLLVLIPSSIALGMFKYNWIWLLPILFSVILNTIVAIKTPRVRFIDILTSVFLISPEFSILFDFIIDVKSWRELSRVERKDAWAEQERAENSQGKLGIGAISVLVVVALVILGLYFKVISVDSALMTLKPYIISAFNVLTYMAVFATILMINKLIKIRGSFKA